MTRDHDVAMTLPEHARHNQHAHGARRQRLITERRHGGLTPFRAYGSSAFNPG